MSQGTDISTLVLVFARVSAFFVSAPFPGVVAPPLVRILAAGGLSLAIASGFGPLHAELSLVMILREVLLGLGSGFLMTGALVVFTLAGEVSGQQMGLGTPGAVNPALAGQLTVLGGAFTFIALSIFAVSGGPGFVVAFLYRSFEVFPFSAPVWFDQPEVVVDLGRILFREAMRAAAPLIAAVFGAQVVLAILARGVPTLNLFIEGPGLTVSAGVLGLLASVHTLRPLVERVFDLHFRAISQWVG